jgi:hypothetical protein
MGLGELSTRMRRAFSLLMIADGVSASFSLA